MWGCKMREKRRFGIWDMGYLGFGFGFSISCHYRSMRFLVLTLYTRRLCMRMYSVRVSVLVRGFGVVFGSRFWCCLSWMRQPRISDTYI
jgi:hypothetical protein